MHTRADLYDCTVRSHMNVTMPLKSLHFTVAYYPPPSLGANTHTHTHTLSLDKFAYHLLTPPRRQRRRVGRRYLPLCIVQSAPKISCLTRTFFRQVAHLQICHILFSHYYNLRFIRLSCHDCSNEATAAAKRDRTTVCLTSGIRCRCVDVGSATDKERQKFSIMDGSA